MWEHISEAIRFGNNDLSFVVRSNLRNLCPRMLHLELCSLKGLRYREVWAELILAHKNSSIIKIERHFVMIKWLPFLFHFLSVQVFYTCDYFKSPVSKVTDSVTIIATLQARMRGFPPFHLSIVLCLHFAVTCPIVTCLKAVSWPR